MTTKQQVYSKANLNPDEIIFHNSISFKTINDPIEYTCEICNLASKSTMNISIEQLCRIKVDTYLVMCHE